MTASPLVRLTRGQVMRVKLEDYVGRDGQSALALCAVSHPADLRMKS
jgi:hypothetical protein